MIKTAVTLGLVGAGVWMVDRYAKAQALRVPLERAFHPDNLTKPVASLAATPAALRPARGPWSAEATASLEAWQALGTGQAPPEGTPAHAEWLRAMVY